MKVNSQFLGKIMNPKRLPKLLLDIVTALLIIIIYNILSVGFFLLMVTLNIHGIGTFECRIKFAKFSIGFGDDTARQQSNIRKALKAFFLLGIIVSFFPDAISPFSLFQLWTISNSNWVDWLTIGKYLFAWGSGLTIITVIINYYFWPSDIFRNEPLIKANQIIAEIFSIIIFASIEEIFFRWLIFLRSIIFIKTINFLCFGWLGFGILQWIHNYIFASICNWMTLGYLENYLMSTDFWFVGASIITTNMLFRDGHRYQGYLGWINSWFLGMFFFWVTLNYGLLAAIFFHSIYNIIVTFTGYLGIRCLKILNY